MEFKGTKGKWVVGIVPEYNDTLKSAMLEVQSKHYWVCKVQNNGMIQSEEGNANAQLIAHAPEMYDEIKESITDLLCIQSNVFDALKTDNRWECVYEIIQKQIDRKKDLLTRATTI